MDRFHLSLFLLNTLMVLLDASLGYFMAPHLPVGEKDSETVARTMRGLLPVIVALYMFFNCLGYFQARSICLLTVSGLLVLDLALQLVLRHRRRMPGSNDGEPGQ